MDVNPGAVERQNGIAAIALAFPRAGSIQGAQVTASRTYKYSHPIAPG